MQRIELIPHLSYSQAASANRCPRQWALRYLLDVKTAASPAMEHGKNVDDVVSAYLANKHGLPIPPGDTVCHGYEVTRDAAAVIAYMADWEVVGVQTRHEGMIEGVGWPVVGYSDFILADGSIWDLKVSRQWRDDWVTQISLYSLLFNRTVYGGVLRVYGGKVTQYNLIVDLEAAAQYVRDAWAVTQAECHPAVPSQVCSWCSVAEECAVWNALESKRGCCVTSLMECAG